MREFEYFLFENFDANAESQNPYNPRKFLGKRTDPILSLLVQQPPKTCGYNDCIDKLGDKVNTDIISRLIDGGVLRLDGTALVLDCPVFIREDAAELHFGTAEKSVRLANIIEANISRIRDRCAEIQNGFPVERNLYHILCGAVFDGGFFDYLSRRSALKTSRPHPSGLDYLTVIYEKCDELRSLSDGLLCSYNRLTNAKCSLQSFGDANGKRFDLYRFYRMMEQNEVPGELKDIEAVLRENFEGTNKDFLLSEAVMLINTGRCSPAAAEVLERFGYTRNGRICVPVYAPEHRKYIMQIESIVEECLGDELTRALRELACSIDITAVRHGVDPLEIANELYHILFGSINEQLVLRGIAAKPQHIPGEGRYFKCIEVYE